MIFAKPFQEEVAYAFGQAADWHKRQPDLFYITYRYRSKIVALYL